MEIDKIYKNIMFMGYRISELNNNEKSLNGIRYLKNKISIQNDIIMSLTKTLQYLKNDFYARNI